MTRVRCWRGPLWYANAAMQGHVPLEVTPPRDNRTAVTVAGIGLTEQEAITLINRITDLIEGTHHADTL